MLRSRSRPGGALGVLVFACLLSMGPAALAAYRDSEPPSPVWSRCAGSFAGSAWEGRAPGGDRPRPVAVERLAWPLERLAGFARELEAAGVDLSATGMVADAQGYVAEYFWNFHGVSTTGNAFYKAATKAHERGWNGFLESAGIDPRKYRRNVHWTRELILSCIRALAAAGRPLGPKELMDDRTEETAAAISSVTVTWTYGASLVVAAIKEFPDGGWGEALAAAGLDPAGILKAVYLTRTQVLRGIRILADAGIPLMPARMLEINATIAGLLKGLAYGPVDARTLYSQGRSLFGGRWTSALRSAGVDPTYVTRLVAIDEAKLLEALGRLRSKGYAPNLRFLKSKEAREVFLDLGLPGAPMSYYVRGVFLHGSWDASLRKAGLDPFEVRLRVPNAVRRASVPVQVEVERDPSAPRGYRRVRYVGVAPADPYEVVSRGRIRELVDLAVESLPARDRGMGKSVLIRVLEGDYATREELLEQIRADVGQANADWAFEILEAFAASGIFEELL